MQATEAAVDNCEGTRRVATDFDDDADVDLYVANDVCPNLLFVNDGTGRFTEEALARGCALSEEGRSQASMGVDAGDFDGDGDLDLFTTNLDLELNALYRNDGAGGFTDDVRRSGLAAGDRGEVGFGTDFFDFDNDGDLDLAIANGHVLSHVHKTRGTLFYEQCDQLFENDGKGRFRLVAPSGGGRLFRRPQRRARPRHGRPGRRRRPRPGHRPARRAGGPASEQPRARQRRPIRS